MKDLGAVVSFKGYYGDLAIVVAKTSYIAEDGIEKRYLPDGMLVLGNTAADGIRCYGAIQDAQALSKVWWPLPVIETLADGRIPPVNLP